MPGPVFSLLFFVSKYSILNMCYFHKEQKSLNMHYFKIVFKSTLPLGNGTGRGPVRRGAGVLWTPQTGRMPTASLTPSLSPACPSERESSFPDCGVGCHGRPWGPSQVPRKPPQSEGLLPTGPTHQVWLVPGSWCRRELSTKGAPPLGVSQGRATSTLKAASGARPGGKRGAFNERGLLLP